MPTLRAFGEVDPARVRTWGNHNRKFLGALEKHYDALAEHARVAPDREGITLLGLPKSMADEFALLLSRANTPEEALRLCGTYHSYHFLTLHQRLCDQLAGRLAAGGAAPDAYRALLLELESTSFELASGFVSSMATLHQGPDAAGYLFCNVGAVWDHEDLDVWAIARTREDVPKMGSLCGRLARESLRWAQHVQFYLAEFLTENAFAGTLDDYRSVLDRDLKNFILVTQVIQASRLAGEESFFATLSHSLRQRYCASEPPTANHEGFLRGALTEIHSLSQLPARVRIIDPKGEVYRLVRIVLSCQAARHHLLDASPWSVLERAAREEPSLSMQYEALGRAFDFSEVMRYLFGLVHSQEAAIALDEVGTQAALAQIAGMMGYGSAPEPTQALLCDYNAHRSALRAAANVFAGELSTYVKSLSVLYRFLKRSTKKTPFDLVNGNVARILLRYAETHQRRVFWEDVIGICIDQPAALQRWARDLARLRGRQLRGTIGRYARFLQEDVARFFELLLLLQGGPPPHRAIAELLFDEALALYEGDESLLSRFTELFHVFPELVARFVEQEDPEATARLVALFRRHWAQRRYRKAGVRLLSLLNLYHFSSNYSKRHSTRVLARYPAAITFLDDFDELERIAGSAMTEALAQPGPAARRQRLGDFYDLEFCRLSLMTLSGVDARRVGREFRRSSERYVAALFETCVEEVAYAMGRPMPRDHQGFALFATGGNAREDPYDVDYDMFAVMRDSHEPERRRFYNRTLARLTRALTERGIVPHNRFTDRFGSYIATIDELRGFLARGGNDSFIEKTELLGSRLAAGDPTLDAHIDEALVTPYVFDDARYPREILAEMEARHTTRDVSEMEVKEARGGLRDAQLFLSILKSHVRVRAPESAQLYARLRGELPRLTSTLHEMERTTAFLKRVRDVYRLTVVSEGALDPTYFGVVALFMGYGNRGAGAAEELLRDYHQALARMRGALSECTTVLGLR